MTEKLHRVYEGDFVNRRTAKLRQIDLAINALIDCGVPVDWIEPEKTRNHELAHIAAHNNGWVSRILAEVFVNESNHITGYRVTHDHHDRKKLAGLDALRTSLAPLFVKDKPVHPLSKSDGLSAMAGLSIALIDSIRHKIK